MTLQDMLYDKAKAEQDSYIAELKKMPPEKIIEVSYEKVMRDDILIALGERNTSDAQAKELLKLKCPLAECYNRWLKTDCSYMDMLHDTISDFADKLVQQTEERKKAKKHQPER